MPLTDPPKALKKAQQLFKYANNHPTIHAHIQDIEIASIILMSLGLSLTSRCVQCQSSDY